MYFCQNIWSHIKLIFLWICWTNCFQKKTCFINCRWRNDLTSCSNSNNISPESGSIMSLNRYCLLANVSLSVSQVSWSKNRGFVQTRLCLLKSPYRSLNLSIYIAIWSPALLWSLKKKMIEESEMRMKV